MVDSVYFKCTSCTLHLLFDGGCIFKARVGKWLGNARNTSKFCESTNHLASVTANYMLAGRVYMLGVLRSTQQKRAQTLCRHLCLLVHLSLSWYSFDLEVGNECTPVISQCRLMSCCATYTSFFKYFIIIACKWAEGKFSFFSTLVSSHFKKEMRRFPWSHALFEDITGGIITFKTFYDLNLRFSSSL